MHAKFIFFLFSYIFHDFMNAYNIAISFEDNFLGTYASLILGAAEKGNISIPKTEDGNKIKYIK
jgi:hypothetical protein